VQARLDVLLGVHGEGGRQVSGRAERARAALAALALVGSGLAALGCGAEDPTVGDEDDIAESKTIFGDDRVGAALKSNARGVPGSFPEFEKLFKVGRSCARTDSKEIFVVEEESSRATGATKEVTGLLPRTVVTGCNTDKQNPESVRSSFNLMVALVSSPDAPNAAKNDPMVLTPVEVMALDDKTGLYNFYVFESSGAGKTGTVTRIQRGPDGAIHEYRKEPGKTLKTSDNQDKRCFNCHVNGGPLMNEMTEPWTNWVSTHKQLPESKLAGDTLSIVSEAAAPHGEHNRSSLANDLEQTMRAAIRTWVVGVATAPGSGHGPETLSGVQPNGLAGLLKSSFCETELNFASAFDTVPLELFLDPSAVSGGSYSRPPADPADIFPILLPVRSEMDKRIELFLQKSGYLSARTISALRAVDDVNDVFSPLRCGLYQEAVKDLPTAPADVDAKVRKAIGDKLRAKVIPAGARFNYISRLIDPAVDDAKVKDAKTLYLAEANKTFAAATALLGTTAGKKQLKARVQARKDAAQKMFPNAANPLPVLD
jgi:hypothetical protein